jgi:hypothetical protein
VTEVTVPNFGELLSPFISAVPEAAIPNFLALLERGAAERYRYWAEQLPQFREGLLRCSSSEDEIADIVEGLFPIDAQVAEDIKALMPAARDTYFKVFQDMPLADQLAIQAEAELQGALAWQAMLDNEVPDAIRAGLTRCSELEGESSAYLTSIVDAVRNS